MPTVTLRIEPDFCGPVSVGTVAVIKLVREHLEIDLRAAMAYVNRCVFDGETVDIPAPSALAAEHFLAAIAALPPVPRVIATLQSEK